MASRFLCHRLRQILAHRSLQIIWACTVWSTLCVSSRRVSNIHTSYGRWIVAVNDYNGVGPSLEILEHLNYENSSVVCSNYHTWKIWGYIESLICYFFISVEETVLIASKVVFGNKWIYVQHAVQIFGRIWPLSRSKDIYLIHVCWNFCHGDKLTIPREHLAQQSFKRPCHHALNFIMNMFRWEISIKQAFIFRIIKRESIWIFLS